MKPNKPNLAGLLAESAGSTRKKPSASGTESAEYSQVTHKGLKPITVHFPKNVRDQIKLIAAEQGTRMQNIIAEAYNDLFAKYGKPEIAPRELQ
jgi:hypothetical protein